MVSGFPETIDVSAEREYARHLAHRLLNEASLALMEGRAGSVRIPRMDPVFGAVCGRSLQLLADRIDTIGTSAPSRPEGTQGKSPDAANIRATIKENRYE